MADFGYACGGETKSGAVRATTDKITYATETIAASTASSLTISRSNVSGIANYTGQKGYISGGTSASAVTLTDKLNFATDITAAQTTANLSSARSTLGGSGSSDNTDGKGYISGGTTSGGTVVNTTDVISYATDTTTSPATAALSTARGGAVGLSSNSGKGYMAGGDTGSSNCVTTTDKITYSNDTTAVQTTANLAASARTNAGGVSNTTDGTGYMAGGLLSAGSKVADADKLVYSSDTTSAKSTANLSVARYGTCGASDGTNSVGYFCGGQSGIISADNTVDKLTYHTDTTAASTAVLSQVRRLLAGVSANEFPASSSSVTSGGYGFPFGFGF